jgi:hypothetical protein
MERSRKPGMTVVATGILMKNADGLQFDRFAHYYLSGNSRATLIDVNYSCNARRLETVWSLAE